MQCPNCGASIKPSLAFCVECGQPVSPTSRAENYRPTPPPWPVAGDEAPLPPPTPSRPVGVPWEDKTRGSVLDRLVDTTRKVLTAPTDFFRSVTTGTGNYVDPVGYSVILQSLAGWVGIVYGLVIERTMGAFVPTVPAQYEPFVGPLLGAVGLGEAVIRGILIPVIAVIWVFIAAGILHLLLLLLGGARNGFEGTLKVVCYVAGAASLITIVPICGNLLIVPLSLFLEVIGISEVHGISRGKAAVAVLLPIVLCCCLLFGLGMVAAIAVPSLIGNLGQ